MCLFGRARWSSVSVRARWWLFFWFPLVAACVFFGACGQKDNRIHYLVVGGVKRTFIVYSPRGVGRSAPLLIALHGGGMNGRVMERFSGLSETAALHGFMLVYPNGSGWGRFLTWNAGNCCSYAQRQGRNDVAFIRELIDYMVREYGVDPNRIYCAGLSNGGMMAYRLAAEIPEKIAAIAVVAGTLTIDPSAIKEGMDILHFHGTEDRFVPYGGGRGTRGVVRVKYMSVQETIGAWARVNGVSAPPIIDELPIRHRDGTRVVRYIYTGKKGDIHLYKVIGGGHTWPGRPAPRLFLGRTTQQIVANDLLWDFFKARRKGGR